MRDTAGLKPRLKYFAARTQEPVWCMKAVLTQAETIIEQIK